MLEEESGSQVVSSSVDAKARIRGFAAELWAMHGYHGVGIEELSVAVGLKRGSLYYYIESKEALLVDILSHAMHRLLAKSRRVHTGLSPTARLEELSRVLISEIAENRSEWIIFFSDGKVLSEKSMKDILTLRGEYETLWIEALEEGVERGEFRKLDPIAVKGLLGMHNYAFVWLSQDGRLTADEVSRVFVDIVLRGIVAVE